MSKYSYLQGPIHRSQPHPCHSVYVNTVYIEIQSQNYLSTHFDVGLFTTFRVELVPCYQYQQGC